MLYFYVYLCCNLLIKYIKEIDVKTKGGKGQAI